MRNYDLLRAFLYVAMLYARWNMLDHCRRDLEAAVRVIDCEIGRLVAEWRQSLIEETSSRR